MAVSVQGVVRELQPGAKVADAAFPNASFPEALAEAGYEGFCGYLSSPTNNSKNWTATRLGWFVNHPQIGQGMFCEQFETIIFQGYSAANLSLGRQCQAMADSFGVPDDVPMWFAVDTSPFGHFDEIAASFQAYNDTNRRPIYAYCGSQCGEFLLDEGLIEGFHVPSAVSWSATSEAYNGETVFTYNNGKNRWYLSPLANMRQHNSIEFAGSRIDPNDVLRPTPFWFPYEVPPTPIEPDDTTELDDMSLVIVLGDQNGWWKGLNDAGQYRSIYEREAQIRMAASTNSGIPIPSVVIPEAEWSSYASELPQAATSTTAPTHFAGNLDLNGRTVEVWAS